jgi:serine/threonine-protein kinase
MADPSAVHVPAQSKHPFLEVLLSRGLVTASRVRAPGEEEGHGQPGWAEELIQQGVPASERPAAADGRRWPVLGQYRLLDQLGSGGMGLVFKAEHLLMKRVVALKVMSAHLVQDQNAVARFHREVQAVAQLSHPNIVTAHDAAQAHGLHFLVMEYVDGIDLGRLVVEVGPLPIPLACECVRQTAVGLQHAHECGLVHCDIKPSNLILTGVRGQGSGFGSRSALLLSPEPWPLTLLVKILDLGLARLAGSSPECPTVHSLPAPCSGPAGTPDFMAPEQGHNTPTADIRSDLYSLGCTFYFLLTGQVPFPGGSWSEKLLKHQFDEPMPIAALRPEVPPEIVAIVQRLMAKQPQDRYPGPAALAEVLEVWLGDQGLDSHRPGDEPPTQAVDTSLAVSGPTPTPRSSSGKTPRQSDEAADPPPATTATRTNLRRSRKRRLPLPLAVAFAVLVGLGLAWVARPLYMAGNGDRFGLKPENGAAHSPSPTFLLASAPEQRFDSLESVLAAAQDGDCVRVRHTGPIAVRPLVVRGKSLTLEAAPGCRPRLTLSAGTAAKVWQPLLSTDRDLVLQGIDLFYDVAGEAVAEARPAHLIWSEGSSLHLRNCGLLAPGGWAPIVCRKPRQVELDRCQVVAQASALSVEVGAGPPPQVQVHGTTLNIRQSGGAALSLWVYGVQPPGPVQLELQGNQVNAGRVVALSGLGCGVVITARDNRFAFHEALLDFVAYPAEKGWRSVTRWEGERNRYQGRGDWIMQEGAPGGVHGLAAWRELWGRPEPGSSEGPYASP